MELHKSIRNARRAAEMTGVDVAGDLGITAAQYRRYERGEVVPNATIIMQLASRFACSEPARMRLGGGEAPDTAVENVQRMDLDLKEGETLTIVLNATVTPSVSREPIDKKPYKRFTQNSVQEQADKKRA